jgi:hypothetical protein
VALRLRSEVLDQQDHPNSTGDRHQNHKSSPGSYRRMNVRVVHRGEFAKEEEVVKNPNEGAKCHSSEARHDADQQR